MTVTHMEILGRDGERRPLLPLTRATRDALARYVAISAPRGRRSWAEREWDLTPDQARAVVEATASAATIDQIWKHPNGGWAVLLPVMGAVIGQELDDFIKSERKKHVEHARRSNALGRDLRALAAGRPRPAAELADAAGRRRRSRGG